MGLSSFDECSKKMVYFALVLSDNAIHFRCNAAAAPGVLPRGGRTRRNRSHASGSLLYTSSFLDHCTLVKRNLAIGLTTDHRIKIDCKWKGTRASLDARNVSSGRVLAAAASSSVSEGTVTVEEVPGASPPTTTGGESLVEEENAAAAEENASVGDAPTSCVETTDEEATEASSVDTPTKPMMQQTSKLSGQSNGHATAAAAAKKLKIRTIQKEELIPGAVFAGKVRAVQAYGAFVDIGAFTDGLLHISQLSSNYVSQVQDVVLVGQEVIVRVVDVDEMAGRISLTMQDETKVAEDHQQTQTLKENQSGDASQGCQPEDAVSKRGKITGKKSRERGKRDEQKQKVYIVRSFSAGLICLFLHLHWWVGLLHILLL
jgi:predicted RNA-binding protein with RPS1 domain